MNDPHRTDARSPHKRRLCGRALVASALVVSGIGMSTVASVSALAGQRVDLRVLGHRRRLRAGRSDQGADGLRGCAVYRRPSATALTAGTLSSGTEAFFQAVVLPNYVPADLDGTELATLRTFENNFGVREVDAYNYPATAVGLNTPGFAGPLDGVTATVNAAGKAGGFGYLNGPVPFSAGSYTYLATLAPPVAGATFTSLVEATAGGVTGPIVGVYASGGVEQMIITAAFASTFPQFKYLGHGIITWMTRGVHFGYNRNYFTFHFDDAFGQDATWNTTLKCTPGEDCNSAPEVDVRMTKDDVDAAVAWTNANNYQLTLPFNGALAATGESLTTALVANKSSFRWLNHGLTHVYQGCLQNTASTPWVCTVNGPNIVWTPQLTIYNEIHDNIVKAQQLGLSFDSTEYLSGEHSGLAYTSAVAGQNQPDNQFFAAALTQANIKTIGADASREAVARVVGGANTVPRHPTALYYNTSTKAQAIDEYNWFYAAAPAGSGACGTTVPPCITPLTLATDFENVIVPRDTAFDMGFMMSNDPRPFYAHVSNLTGDRLAYYLLNSILGAYRAAFTTATPVVNLTLTQAADQLVKQQQWATDKNVVSGYVLDGAVTITNTTGHPAPFTAPAGSTIANTTLQPYGGEASAWVAMFPQFTSAPSATAVPGTPFSFTVTTAGSPTPTITRSGTLPTGITFTDLGNGTAKLAGTAVAAQAGQSFPLTFTATNSGGATPQAFTMSVSAVPAAVVASVVPTLKAMTPARLADTRPGFSTVDGQFAGQGARPTGSTLELVVAGRGGVPADAAAVALNVTVAEPIGSGFVTVYPCGAAQPLASNLNYTAGAVVPNAVLAKVGTGGKVCLFVSNGTQLIVDVNGYFPATSTFHSMNPARVLETRPGQTTVDGLQQGIGIRPAGTITSCRSPVVHLFRPMRPRWS